ncbi:flagellar type III secretion system protein FliR [Dasania sp. GY-MA-18]|uniref:Flagellar biosynthetic protein FliR n=1 Tax=Dasania phycosphaerae TaxID=2950436 RepID=A0A9J6RID2_9GAMM|nr:MULTISPECIES: flagellar biosynthetic protein FliR [Dasania]MCR8921669.1 flagellar type III secretion system protein FliR [Dasania sp. GY-MA-18]MCZ0864097.1 flagellar biosynthetic protein FliR [Dasania phycosphaerae]MCZ0867825.1 flagellar biosynthetic protein FliR [Dasania phycosphaerae]
MVEITAAQIGGWLGQYLWPLFRISGFFMLAPVVGSQLVPARIRLMLSILTALVLAPVLPAMPAIDAVSLNSAFITIQQVLIGVAMALALQMLLQVFILAGQMIAMQMGLGFASMVDPSNGISVTVVSQFHLMLATLLFVAVGGHLAMIEVLAESFIVLPVGAGFISNNALWSIMGWFTWMFAAGVLMALPAVTSLMIVNAALGVITRSAPQFNIMTIGFPFMVILGLAIIWATMGNYLPHFEYFTRDALDMMADLVAIR